MPPVGFEPTISAGERPKTYALDRAATGTGKFIYTYLVQMLIVMFAVALVFLFPFCCIENGDHGAVFL